MTQAKYARKMEALPPCSEYEAFRSLRHKQAWLGHSRPDIIAPVNILSQVTPRTFSADSVKSINAVVKRVSAKLERGIMHH